MRCKRRYGLFWVCIIAYCCSFLNAGAVEIIGAAESVDIIERATGRFSMTIEANSFSSATSSFPMEAGETVTINASYSPSAASVDFGVMDEDGTFYYLNVTGGSINETIVIEERGHYRLTVRNNSSREIDVMGFVTY